MTNQTASASAGDAPYIAEETAWVPRELARPGLTLSQIGAILAARWPLILGLAVGIALATYLFSKLLPKAYEASSSVLLDFAVYDPTSNREFSSGLAASYVATQLDFIKSPLVLGAVAEQLGWQNDAKLTKRYIGSASGRAEYVGETEIAPNLTVVPGKESRVVFITYEGKSAQEAAIVANLVAKTYTRMYFERNNGPTMARAKQYTAQVNDLRRQVEAAQQDIIAFRRRTGLIDLTTVTDAETTRLTDLETRLTAAESEQQLAAARQAQIVRPGLAGTLSTVVGADQAAGGYLQAVRTQLDTAQAHFDEISKVLGPNHPDYIAAKQTIDQLKAQIASENTGVTRAASGTADRYAGLEADLRRQVDAQRARILAIREQQDEAAVLTQRLDAAKKLYEQALGSYDQVLRESQSRYSNVSMVSEAVPPSKPARPKPAINAALGLIGGLFFALLIVFLRELSDRRVRCRDDIERDLGLPFLAETGHAGANRAVKKSFLPNLPGLAGGAA